MNQKNNIKSLLLNVIDSHFDEVYGWINAEIAKTSTYQLPISENLSSDEAKAIFSKLRKAKILGKNNMPDDLSWAERGILANFLARQLNVVNVWHEFGILWQLNKESLRKGYLLGLKQPKTKLFMDRVKKILN